jgi:hypothetical protein
MAPERYHSNVLEPLTPPRTLCERLRTRRLAPCSLTGNVVHETTRGWQFPFRSSQACAVGGGSRRLWAAGFPSAGDALVADRARKGIERLLAHEASPRACCGRKRCLQAEASRVHHVLPQSAGLGTGQQGRCLGLWQITASNFAEGGSNSCFLRSWWL